MLKVPSEMLLELAGRIRNRRVILGWTQQEAARRAGIPYRTWRRLENEGKASLEDMIKSSVALRCENTLDALFPQPAATSLDDILKRQAEAATAPVKMRARKPRTQ